MSDLSGDFLKSVFSFTHYYFKYGFFPISVWIGDWRPWPQLAAFYNCRPLFFKIMLMIEVHRHSTTVLFEWATGNTLTIYIKQHKYYIYI